MAYTGTYQSPLGNLLLAADDTGLTGLWFEGQKYFARTLPEEQLLKETPVLAETRHWLNIYFSGKEPAFTPPLHPAGSAFRQAVWQILLQIPYGKTMTYGEIAREVAKRQQVSHMSAQAVGGAVGHNAISIIIPCHRVIGANGSLTGYAGGIDKKAALLELERTITDTRKVLSVTSNLICPCRRSVRARTDWVPMPSPSCLVERYRPLWVWI